MWSYIRDSVCVLTLLFRAVCPLLTCYRCQNDLAVAEGAMVSYAAGAYQVQNMAVCGNQPFVYPSTIPTAQCAFTDFFCMSYNYTFGGRLFTVMDCASTCTDGSTMRTQGNTAVTESYKCCQLNYCNGNFSVTSTPAPFLPSGAETCHYAWSILAANLIAAIVVIRLII